MRLRTVFALALAVDDVPEARIPRPSTNTPEPTPQKAVVFRALFDEHFPRVRRYVSSFLDNAEEVEEITAEVFVVAWRKLQPAKPMGWTWFMRVASNMVRDAERRARSRSRAMDAVLRRAQNTSPAADPLDILGGT